MRMLSRISFVLFAPILGALLLSAAPVQADERDAIFNIPSQTLDSALIAFSEQADVQVVVASSATTGIRTRGVAGQLSPQAALTALLANSGLQFQPVGKKTFALAEATPAAAPPRESANKSDAGKSVDQPQQVIPKSTEAGQARQDEVVVTGSRLRRAEDEGPAPVIVFDRKEIDRLGVTNVADVLNYLPQRSFDLNEQWNFGGSRTIQLRGLPAPTLVLINGRRTVTSALLGGANAFDLNTIPLAAVDRIEVLADSASAVYGTDAIGGVINVLLKAKIKEPIVDLNYGAADGGGDERRASFTYGHAWNRARISLVADVFDREYLPGTERDLYANRDFRRYDSADLRASTANPGNISSRTAANLPGLPSRTAAVPVGSSGLGLTSADFLATAGQVNLESTSRFSSVVPETERFSGMVTGQIDLTPALTAFGELLYSDRADARQSPPSTLSNRLVPVSNPFNPFGVPVNVSYLFTGAGSRQEESEARSFRGVIGLKGRQRSWDWEFSALGTDEDGTNVTRNAVDNARVNASLASTDPALALNVFQDGPGGSPALLASLLATPSNNHYGSRALQGGGFLRGKAFTAPAGGIELVLGGEIRTEEITHRLMPSAVKRQTASAFAEISAPLVDASMSVPLVRRLTATIAGRLDDYDDIGEAGNPQYGLEWSPLDHLLLRASYATSFRAPSLFDLYQPLTTFATNVVDTQRNGELTPISVSLGGNPSLEPEQAESLTAGFLITLGAEDSVRFGAGYWQIRQSEWIRLLDQNLIVANEALFPDRVLRAPPTPADIAQGYPGQVLSVDAAKINIGRLDTSGVDFEFSGAYRAPFGRLALSLMATWVDTYQAADIPDAPAKERVGIAFSAGTIPEWRGTATCAWTHRGLGLSTTVRYTSSYDDADFLNTPNGRVVESKTLVDVQGSVDVSEMTGSASWWQKGLKVRAGVTNVFDEAPSFSEIALVGFDPSQGDVRQRFAYFTLSKAF